MAERLFPHPRQHERVDGILRPGLIRRLRKRRRCRIAARQKRPVPPLRLRVLTQRRQLRAILGGLGRHAWNQHHHQGEKNESRCPTHTVVFYRAQHHFYRARRQQKNGRRSEDGACRFTKEPAVRSEECVRWLGHLFCMHENRARSSPLGKPLGIGFPLPLNYDGVTPNVFRPGHAIRIQTLTFLRKIS